MARISTYALDNNINDEDKLVGTDADDNNITKNFTLEGVAEYVIDTLIDPDAIQAFIPVFRNTDNTDGGNATRITGSIIKQNSYPTGSLITIAGDLTLERDQSDTTLTLISDSSNIGPGGDQHNPSIKFIQDGGAQNAAVGFNIIDDTAGGTLPGTGNRFWIVNAMDDTLGAGGITFGTAQVDGWENAIGRFIIRGDGKGLFGHPDSLYSKTLGSQFEIYDNRDENTTTDPSFSVYSVVDFAAPSGNEGAGGIKQILDVYDNGVFQQQEAMMLIPGTNSSDFAASTPLAFYTNSDMDTASPSGFAGIIFDSGNWLLDGSGTFTTTDPGYQLKVAGTGLFTDQVTIPETPVAGTDAASKAYVDLQNTGQVSGTGTTNTLTIWSDGPNSVLSDSVVSEETGTAYGTTKNLVVDGNIYQSNMGTSVSIGENALANGDAGILGENVAIGKDSLNALTTATNNIGIGANTLQSTNSNNNIAIGKNSQISQTTGLGNISLGFNSLSGTNVGNTNIAIGHTAVQNVATGAQGITGNVILGTGAVNATTITGGLLNNVIIGINALEEADAATISSGVFIGNSAGKFIEANATTDIGIGFSAFYGGNNGFNSAGDNIAIGANANGSNSQTGVTRSIKIGSDAGSAGSYAVNISAVNTNSYSVNYALGEHAAIIGGANNSIQGAEAAFTGGGRDNTINSGAIGGAILGGYSNTVSSGGSAGMALGSNLTVEGENQIVVGRYNAGNNNSKLIVGAGFSDANRINAFEVKNTSQLKLGKYGGTQFLQTGDFYNLLTVSSTGNVNEVPVANLNPQNLEASNYTVDPNDIVNLPGDSSSRLVKISWGSVNNGTMTLRLPATSNFSNKTIQIITDGTFDVGGGKKIDIEGSFGSGDTIDGGTSFELSKKYEGVTLWSDGTEWFVIQAKAH